MQIFLTGYMGVGKSTLGKKLAGRLRLGFVDLDNYFEEKFKTSITLFFERFGEEMFRKLENEILIEIIENFSEHVISTGGGTPCYFDNMELMNSKGTTIYLKLPAAMLSHRLLNSPFRYKRPRLKGLDKDSMLLTVTAHLAEREEFYNQSKLIIEVNKMNIDEIVSRIVELTFSGSE